MNKINVSNFSINNQQFDYFICASSFEDRSTKISSLIKNNVNNSLVLELIEYKKFYKNNTKIISEYFKNKVTILEIEHINYAKTFIDLSENIFKMKEKSNIAVDITTLNHEILLMILYLLKQNKNKYTSIFIYYSNAAKYDTGEEDAWLSMGVRDIRSILGYPGDMLPTRENNLFVLVGYEQDRALRLIEHFEPMKMTIGFGESIEVLKNIGAEKNNKLVREKLCKFDKNIGKDITEFKFPCADPIKVRDTLINQIDIAQDCNIIIAPMNSKLSTIGCGLAAFERPRVQLCYAQALSYNVSNYSQPGDSVYYMDIKPYL